MYIAIDIGNSNISTGIFIQDICKFHYRIDTHLKDLELVFPIVFSNYIQDKTVQQVKFIYISSVVPLILIKILNALEPYNAKIKIIDSSCYSSLSLKILRPKEIGTDLVCNAFAAYSQVQKAVSIIDFGTALTTTTVADDGTILGVSITPGLKTALKSLNSQTAKLPVVSLSIPDSVLGKNTEHAIQAGVMLGYIGLVKYLIEQIKKEINQPLTFFATGGLVKCLPPLYFYFDQVDPLLTLKGIYLIGQNL